MRNMVWGGMITRDDFWQGNFAKMVWVDYLLLPEMVPVEDYLLLLKTEQADHFW